MSTREWRAKEPPAILCIIRIGIVKTISPSEAWQTMQDGPRAVMIADRLWTTLKMKGLKIHLVLVKERAT